MAVMRKLFLSCCSTLIHKSQLPDHHPAEKTELTVTAENRGDRWIAGILEAFFETPCPCTTAALPQDHFRDDCGNVRSNDGHIVRAL